ncbi:type IV secretion system protein [Erythrobacter sp. HL-111]|uniref:type IV secretion system protein n=1 Tax=Erythrobacter sp. HL-111 TaxID=1798193 RepID=UPI0006DB897A|nr:type IV secretion system protein [Erythrobacter sp. HL-111]KPP93933.1 MAG: type IV secretion system protein VirB6 [Erythrobacteraceae bacterium HL-111]SDS32839.1 type IV secretion system protein VirB6 [Erythrobacter sp. HL-111]
MTTSCDLVTQDMGAGVAAALTAVDCIASQVSEQAFGRLFGDDGQMRAVLVTLLVFYFAFFGISLMLGRSNLSVRHLVPKILTVGLVLSFATSFVAYSTVFYNFFVLGPDWVAGALTGSEGSATATFAQKLDVVFLAVQEASSGKTDINAFSPPGMMWLGAMLLLLGTVGLLVTARIGLALLLAVGPIFVVLALFEGTRGLFTGWLKGMTMLALAPLFAVLGGTIMLEIAVPILAVLVATPGEIDQQAAMGFFLVGAVHVALMFMALKVAATMVAGWQVFGLARASGSGRGIDTTRMARDGAIAAMPGAARSAAAPAASAAPRRIDVAGIRPAAPANDYGTSAEPGTVRETRVYAASSGGTRAGEGGPAASRTHGIGNRFRPASSRSSPQRAKGAAAPKTETPR